MDLYGKEIGEKKSASPVNKEGLGDDRDILLRSIYIVCTERWENHSTSDECNAQLNKLIDEYLKSQPTDIVSKLADELEKRNPYDKIGADYEEVRWVGYNTAVITLKGNLGDKGKEPL